MTVLKNKVLAFCAGFIIGLIASWTYILADGDYWFSIPLWAEIVFYPGLLVGNYCYDIFGNILLAQVIGTLAVGLFYGIVMVVMFSSWKTLSRRQ